MWVYIYESTQSSTKDASIYDNSSNAVPLYDGQYFLQDSSDNGKFYTWNRSKSSWATITAINPNLNIYWSTISVYVGAAGFVQELVRRLHYHNCNVWNMCDSAGGSYYSLRSSVNIYDDNGTLVGPYGTSKSILFDNGWGYTKATSLSQLASGSGGVRMNGYRDNASGVFTKFDNTIFYYVGVDFTLHPLNYPINTA